jgi:hypothetical protein
MDSERFEIESEAWFRAVAEGRVQPVSDRPRDAWRALSPSQAPRRPDDRRLSRRD